jgi:hypothetical protein
MQWTGQYWRLQEEYVRCVETGDPNSIAELLQFHPFHVDSLIQLAQVCHHTNELETATDLIERAIHCFEACWHPLFYTNLMKGTARFLYAEDPNRPFFLALYNYIQILGKRGCSRTALEYCKLMLAFEEGLGEAGAAETGEQDRSSQPEGDPFGVHLVIDYYALRAKEYVFLPRFLRQYRNFGGSGGKDESDLSALADLPNFAFSLALAQYHIENEEQNNVEPSQVDHTRSSEYLERALLLWPMMLGPLLEKCAVRMAEKDRHGTWDEIATHKIFSTNYLTPHKYLIILYAKGAYTLWKHNRVLTWLKGVAKSVTQRADGSDPLVFSLADKRNAFLHHYPMPLSGLYNHVLLSEDGEAIRALPGDVPRTFQLYSEETLRKISPPPLASATTSTPAQAQLPQNPLALFLSTLLPWGQLPAELQPQAQGQGQGQGQRPAPAEWLERLLQHLNAGGGGGGEDDAEEDEEDQQQRQ